MSRALDYLRADLHRAQHHGAKTMEVHITDLAEIIARLEAAETRAAVEFGGKPLGFSRADKVRAFLSGTKSYLTVRRHKTAEFDTRVCFTDLPPKPDAPGAS